MLGVDSPEAGGTAVTGALAEIDGSLFLVGLQGGLAWLEANQEEVNELNVYPVPDGDTGSNMYLTLRAAVEEAQRATDPSSAASVAAAAARGSLLGARGNSGVILSQILRGVAQGLDNRPRVDAAAIVGALDRGVEVAYRAVIRPTEGTILTVVRECARAAQQAAGETADIRVVIERTALEAHAAVDRTIDQLDVLREAGVVDAGGFGLAVILEGMARTLANAGPSTAAHAPGLARSAAPLVRLPEGGEGSSHDPTDRPGGARIAAREGGWGHCTEFLVHGPGLDVDQLRLELSTFGESLLVVGDAELIRVHVHTHDPSALISAAAERGRLSALKVDDMSAQHHDIVERARAEAPPRESMPEVGVVAVASGEGFKRILTSVGADRVVEGGQTMNPSIEDLLTAVRAAATPSVVLLPNNGNVVLTAQQVDALAEGVDVQVVPTRNVPQGISALLALDRQRSARDNCERMREAIAGLVTVEITRAVRDSGVNGLEIAAGDVIALVDEEITHVGDDYLSVIDSVLRNLDPGPDLVTVFRGAEIGDEEAAGTVAALRERHPAVDFELHEGGQEHYPYVLSIE